MKKNHSIVLSAVVVFALLISFSACENKAVPETSSATGTSNVQLPNPILEYESLDEAWTVLGFEFKAPLKLPEGYVQDGIITINAQLGQVVYKNGENMIVFRAAKGHEDISGDYNTYDSTKTLFISDLQVTTRGNSEKTRVALWNNEDLCYSLTFSAGISDAQLSDIIQSMSY